MPPIELGPTRPVGAVQVKTISTAGTAKSARTDAQAQTPAATSASPQVQTSDALKAGTAPVDSERVATIRKAIEDGHYPVLPAKIADAMIAAGMLLRTPQ
jgi:negative regulator of flagellin synthesis FlgM